MPLLVKARLPIFEKTTRNWVRIVHVYGIHWVRVDCIWCVYNIVCFFPFITLNYELSLLDKSSIGVPSYIVILLSLMLVYLRFTHFKFPLCCHKFANSFSLSSCVYVVCQIISKNEWHAVNPVLLTHRVIKNRRDAYKFKLPNSVFPIWYRVSRSRWL